MSSPSSIPPCAAQYHALRRRPYDAEVGSRITDTAPSEVTIPLEVPPRVHSGTILELPLDRWGITNLWLRRIAGLGTPPAPLDALRATSRLRDFHR